MLIKNLRRVATVAILAPVVILSGPAIATAQDGNPQGRHGSSVDDGGILSNLVTVNLGRDSDRSNDRDRDGILSDLLTVNLGSSERDDDRRDNRNDRDDDGILSDLLGGDRDGLLGNDEDDDDGLLGLRIL